VPHMGWNRWSGRQPTGAPAHPLWAGRRPTAAASTSCTATTPSRADPRCAAGTSRLRRALLPAPLRAGDLFATQFHPEKSAGRRAHPATATSCNWDGRPA
jgi:imidazoleglycerol phosphate synthase glutamine amidotransferase subunit HisH